MLEQSQKKTNSTFSIIFFQTFLFELFYFAIEVANDYASSALSIVAERASHTVSMLLYALVFFWL